MIHICGAEKRTDDSLTSFKLKPLDYSHAILKAFHKNFFEKGWPNLFLLRNKQENLQSEKKYREGKVTRSSILEKIKNYSSFNYFIRIKAAKW
jgi:hypothetical protein